MRALSCSGFECEVSCHDRGEDLSRPDCQRFAISQDISRQDDDICVLSFCEIAPLSEKAYERGCGVGKTVFSLPISRSRCEGCTDAVIPRLAKRSTSSGCRNWACSMRWWACPLEAATPACSNASSVSLFALSPMAWIHTHRPFSSALRNRSASQFTDS